MKKPSLRTIIQIIFFVLLIVLWFLHQNFWIEKAAPIDAYCPFGAVESFFTLIFKGEFLKRIFTSSFILMWIFFVATLFFGRVFCSYFCPLWAVQEWLRKLWKKLGIKKDLELPEKLDKYLRYLKYVILALIVYFSFYLWDLIFRNYDPFTSFMHFWSEFDEKIVWYSILILIFVWSLFTKSIWCRYFCPLWAFYWILNKIGFHKIKRNKTSCISCKVCKIECPANLKVWKMSEVKNADCISCSKCIKKCPKSSLNHYILWKKVSKKIFFILVMIFVIIPLLVAPFTPVWKTKSESNIINSKWDINIWDIRWSNTLEYLNEVTKVPINVFIKNFNLPDNVDLHMKIKDIGVRYNIINKNWSILETENFRELVDDYINNKNIEVIPDCPFWNTNCEFPGECGFYIDTNIDHICDNSQ